MKVTIELENSHRISFATWQVQADNVQVQIRDGHVFHTASHIQFAIPLNSCHCTNGDATVLEQLIDYDVKKVILGDKQDGLFVFDKVNLKSMCTNEPKTYTTLQVRND